jgi:hypothetical protein
MSEKYRLGAIDTETNVYTPPFQALKGRAYKCLDCDKKVILRKGEIRVAHFAHYAQTTTCSYYEHPSEAQIHKDAKLLLAKLLNEKKPLRFTWCCNYKSNYGKECGGDYAFTDKPSIKYKSGDEVILEYRDPQKRWVADVAIVNNGMPRYIFEIKNTHATTTQRPEPWFEIDARKFIEEVTDRLGATGIDAYEEGNIIGIPCIRTDLDRKCYGSFCYREPWVRLIPGFDKNQKDNHCILCKKTDYEPQYDGSTGKFQKGAIRVCFECLVDDIYKRNIRKLYAGEEVKDDTYVMSEEDYTLLGKIPPLDHRAGQQQGWRQDLECVGCGRVAYSPVYNNKKYYSICKLCLANEETKKRINAKIQSGKINIEQKCIMLD